jgi:hypothetical protein
MVKTNSAAPPVCRGRSLSAAKRAWRAVAVWLVALASLFTTNAGWAASGKSVDVVLMIEGADVNAVRRDVTAVLPPRFVMQDPDVTKAALAKEGVMGSFADSLSNQRVRKQALSAVHKSLKQQGTPALIAVRARRGRNGARDLRVVLVMSEQVEPVVEEDITLGRNEKMGNKIGRLLALPLEDIEASSEKAVAAAPKAAPEKPDADRPAPEKTSKKTRAEPATEAPEPNEPDARVSAADEPPQRDTAAKKKRDKADFNNALLIAEAGIDVGSRKMVYSDPILGPLRPYLAPGVPGYSFSGQFYPGASSGIAFAKDIGLVGRYAGSLAFESKTRDGSQVASGSWTRSAVGVRGRILAGPKETGPYIGIEGTYGNWAFVFTGDAPIFGEVPSVRYKYLRAGADARFPFGQFAVTVAAGYMQVLSAGEYSDRFPHASIGGVDGQLGAAYAFLPWMEARLKANYTRIFSSANPQRGDTYIAGGALDEYFIFNGGVAAAL